MELERRAIENIELDKVLSDVASGSLSREGRARICADAVSDSAEEIEKRYKTIDSYMNLLEGSDALPLFPDLEDVFREAGSSHLDLSGISLRNAGEYLDSYFAVMAFLRRSSDVHDDDIMLSSDILSFIDSEGNVNESHPRLKPFIKAIEQTRKERLSYSERFISQNKGAVQNSNPLYKNERVVIPVKAGERIASECYISGQSQSGSTLFAEPFELVNLNNGVVLAEERLRAEKLRILHELSERVRSFIPVLKDISVFIADFDFHYSFAVWARKNKASHPMLGTSISMIEARHPLLGRRAVPITLKLDSETRVLVLSGANAGGKTVTMKTVALNAALFQMSGFALLNELSSMVIFSHIMADIGDGQSIADSASTFSSHMSSISAIMRKSDQKSLILLDELGSGTDPEEGAALSIAILQYFSGHSFLTITTSHYSAVKNYAYTAPDMANASMEFDAKSGRPTYRVLEGIPGDSHAIAAARRASMPEEIIENAEKLLGSDRTTGAGIIAGLISKSKALDRKITEAELMRRSAAEHERLVRSNSEKLERRLLELEKSGYRELDSYISESRKRIERMIRDAGSDSNAKKAAGQIRAHIGAMEARKDEIGGHISRIEDKFDKSDAHVFKTGDDVVCSDANIHGRIISDAGRGRYLVALENGLRMEIQGRMIRLADKVPAKAEVAHYDISRKAVYEMDVRGLTLAEAISRIDSQIEAAVFRNLSSFSIIHGYGDGILSRGIHSYLKKCPEVEDYRFALPEDGGMGKTYVRLKS